MATTEELLQKLLDLQEASLRSQTKTGKSSGFKEEYELKRTFDQLSKATENQIKYMKYHNIRFYDLSLYYVGSLDKVSKLMQEPPEIRNNKYYYHPSDEYKSFVVRIKNIK